MSSLLTLSLRERETDPEDSVLRCADIGDVGGDASGFLTGFTSLKMCTVSEAEETQSSVEVALNDMWYILAGMVPLLNSKSG